MSFKKYLLDKTVQITVSIVGFIIAILMLNAFKVENDLKIALTILFFLVVTFNIIFDYFRKYKFYKKILNTLDKLDKKYLILEILNKPNFYDGEIFYQILYDINKSMIENVKEYNLSITDFKEYVEMWIHEVKIPVASLTLLIHNNKNMFDKRYIEQIRKLDNYIDQILYFVRSENAEKDYLIKEIELQKIIKDVALKNKDDLLENKVNLEVDIHNEKVLTDSKWLEFVLNQIINNSIKYKKNNNDPIIKISVKDEKDKVYLTIWDNGIGIPKESLNRIFERFYRVDKARSRDIGGTGLGLAITKHMVKSLGGNLVAKSQSKLGKEDIVSLNPDVIYVVYMPYSGDDPQKVKQENLDKLLKDESFKSLDAVKNGRVVPLMLGDMYASGVRTANGIETISQGLYPSLNK